VKRLLISLVLCASVSAAATGRPRPAPTAPAPASSSATTTTAVGTPTAPPELQPQAPTATPAAPETAAPTAPKRIDKVKVAVLDLTTAGVSLNLAANLTNVVAAEIAGLEIFSVVSRADIRAMLTHEQDRNLLGCDSSSDCMADLGGALGVRYLVSGSVGRIGDRYTLSLSVADVERGRQEARVTDFVARESDLIDQTRRSSRAVVANLLAERQATLIVTSPEPGATIRLDGKVVGTTPAARLRVAWGPHRLELEKTGFITAAEELTVQTRGVLERQLSLIPSPDFLEAYESRAGKVRLGAWLSTGASALTLGAAVAFQLKYLDTAARFDTRRSAYDAAKEKSAEEWNALDTLQQSANGELLAARIAGGVGAAFAITAVVLWIVGEDPNRYARYRGLAPGDDPATPHASLELFGNAGPVAVTVAFP
jgi:hypothetical protein